MKSIQLIKIFILLATLCIIALADSTSGSTFNSINMINDSAAISTINATKNRSNTTISIPTAYNNKSNSSNSSQNWNKHEFIGPSAFAFNYNYLIDQHHYDVNGTQRNRRDSIGGVLDSSEIARQNQITEQILRNYLERRLFPFTKTQRRIPTIAEILPKPKTTRSSAGSRTRSITETSPTYKLGLANSSNRSKLYHELRQRNSNQQKKGRRPKHGRQRKRRKNKLKQRPNQGLENHSPHKIDSGGLDSVEEAEVTEIEETKVNTTGDAHGIDDVSELKSDEMVPHDVADEAGDVRDGEGEGESKGNVLDMLNEMTNGMRRYVNCRVASRINCNNGSYNDRLEGYHYRTEDGITDRDNNEALQTVESAQYDRYFRNNNDHQHRHQHQHENGHKNGPDTGGNDDDDSDVDADGDSDDENNHNNNDNNDDVRDDDGDDDDIFKRDPKENEIDSAVADCPNCVDDIQYMNKWTMPLLKLGEKRYYLGIFFKANWFKATQYCRYHGMHLASISSQEENDRLEKHIRDYGLGHEHFWTSGTDLADEGSFFWMSTGRPITFTNWNAGEPNNFRYENGEEENCLELWNRDGKGLKWNDSPCSFETYFVCEIQPN